MSKWLFAITWIWMIIIGLVLVAGIALSATVALVLGIITILLGLAGFAGAKMMMKKMPMEKMAEKK
ncbi:MAG TPA: hypothetical protein VMB35_02410 [Methanomicrobiales archaeon]|nr:hypothetical protein [Methanomicrobiales archaeon]